MGAQLTCTGKTSSHHSTIASSSWGGLGLSPFTRLWSPDSVCPAVCHPLRLFLPLYYEQQSLRWPGTDCHPVPMSSGCGLLILLSAVAYRRPPLPLVAPHWPEPLTPGWLSLPRNKSPVSPDFDFDTCLPVCLRQLCSAQAEPTHRVGPGGASQTHTPQQATSRATAAA